MVKAKTDDIKEELEKEQEKIYGQGTMPGHAVNPEKVKEKSTKEHLKEMVGDDAPIDPGDKGYKKGFNLGEEMNEDEEKLA